jgi:hypothetical protein
MGVILYFAFGALNIVLLYQIANYYRRVSDIDLFPGRESGSLVDMVLNILAYIVCGPFGTILVIMVGIFLFVMWVKYYRKK